MNLTPFSPLAAATSGSVTLNSIFAGLFPDSAKRPAKRVNHVHLLTSASFRGAASETLRKAP